MRSVDQPAPHSEVLRLLSGRVVRDDAGRLWRVGAELRRQGKQLRLRAYLLDSPSVWADLPVDSLTIEDDV